MQLITGLIGMFCLCILDSAFITGGEGLSKSFSITYFEFEVLPTTWEVLDHTGFTIAFKMGIFMFAVPLPKAIPNSLNRYKNCCKAK